jgi:hypothetical protein
MTLEELRAWLAAGGAQESEARVRLTTLTERAAAGASGALQAIADLTVREQLVVEKYDKTDVVAAGLDGLTPYETVVIDFEDGRVVRTDQGQRRTDSCP